MYDKNIITTHQRGYHGYYSTWKRNRQFRDRDFPVREAGVVLPELFRNRPAVPGGDFAGTCLPRHGGGLRGLPGSRRQNDYATGDLPPAD
ncbi:MAG: hypothetical protein IKO65_09790 [Victivallales bacterium]|nr:hypothetical protein [Victivallales bacterium]